MNVLENTALANQKTASNSRKIILSVAAGILCFFLSPFGIQITWEATTISLPWSIVFPIIISMIYGWRFALIAGISGGALFPFYLWFNNGYPNLATALIYLSFYMLLAFLMNTRVFQYIKIQSLRILIVFVLFVTIFKLYYTFAFSFLLSLNPPLWNSNTINYLSPEILNGFFIKDSLNFLAFMVISYTLVQINFIRKLLQISILPEKKNNGMILFLAIVVALLIWASYVLLGNSLLHNENALMHEHIILALLVTLTSGIIVAKLIMNYSEAQIKHKQELIAAKVKAEESEARFKAIALNTPDHIVIMDSELNYTTVINPQFGLTEADMIGKNDYDILLKDDADKLTAIKREVLKNGVPFNHETILVNPKGVNEYFEGTFVPKFDPEGTKNGLIGYFRNVTKQKNSEHELFYAKEKAIESDRLKTAFLQNMSHEIRTPMNAIMGFSGLLSKNFNNKEKIENFANIISQRCHDLLGIINDILDISKIESGQNTISLEPCNISELFNELNLFFSNYKKRLNKQHIHLSFQPTDGLLLSIKTDKLKLKQVLINLITNALKFTETGSVTCICKAENDKVLFQISDTGIGIPADKFEHIFERFSQLNHPTAQNIGGTGLGLPIVKGLVELLGGKVWLESECNKGTTFYFTINHVKDDTLTDAAIQGEPRQQLITSKTILIVEDDFYNSEYLKEVLHDVTPNIVTVAKGMSAVKIVQERKIDLILMDIRLPDISGYEATRLILQSHPNMKIIVQTAYAASTERQNAIEAGCVDYISKPTNEAELLNMIETHFT